MYKTTGTLDGCNIDIPDRTAINERDDTGTTTWSYPTMIMPEVKVLKAKNKVLFYYWNDKTLFYAIYEENKKIEFKPTDDFLEVLSELGVFE